MHIKLRQAVKPWYDDDESLSINLAIPYAEPHDAMMKATCVYKKESKEKPHTRNRSQKSSKPTYQKKFNNTVFKERKASSPCLTCGNKRHLSHYCPDKKDEGKWKAVKKELISNRGGAETSAEEVYINSMEIKTYASSGKTAHSIAKAKQALGGMIKINGHDTRVALIQELLEKIS